MNAITHARTSSFRILPELREDFEAFVESLSVEGTPTLQWDDDGERVAILDVGDMDYLDENEDVCDDGMDQLMRFVAPGQAVCRVWAGYTGFQWVGGGAEIGMKELNGHVEYRKISTQGWMKEQIRALRPGGWEIELPVDL